MSDKKQTTPRTSTVLFRTSGSTMTVDRVSALVHQMTKTAADPLKNRTNEEKEEIIQVDYWPSPGTRSNLLSIQLTPIAHSLEPLVTELRRADMSESQHHRWLQLLVSGMTCQSCVQAIHRQLMNLDTNDADETTTKSPPVWAVSVDLESGLVEMEYDPDQCTPKQLMETIEDCGFTVQQVAPLDTLLQRSSSSIEHTPPSSRMSLRDRRHSDGNTGTLIIATGPAVGSNQPPSSRMDTNTPLFPDTAKIDPIEEPLISGKKAVLEVQGMTCASCVRSIETALKQVPGIQKVQVSLLTERAEVYYDDQVIRDTHSIVDMIEDIGFGGKLIADPSAAGQIELMLHGPADCPRIKEKLIVTSGVFAVEILAEDRIQIAFDARMVGIRDLIEVIQSTGPVDALPVNSTTKLQLQSLVRVKEIIGWRKAFLKCLWFFIPQFCITHALPWIPGVKALIHTAWPVHGVYPLHWVELGLTIPVQFVIGKRFYISAYKALKHGSATMDVLIALSTTCAFSYSLFAMMYAMIYWEEFVHMPPMLFFDTSTMLITFVLLGKYLESVAKGRTSSALAKLYHLQPPSAVLVTLDPQTKEIRSERTIASEWIKVGDVLKILPGEKIPSDGVVVHGRSIVDESFVTGEPVAVSKKRGDFVIGGTVNGYVRTGRKRGQSLIFTSHAADDIPMSATSSSSSLSIGSLANSENSVLFVKATRVGNDTALSQIIKLVENAQATKPAIQNIADTISSYFVPTVVFLSVLVGFFCIFNWCILTISVDFYYMVLHSLEMRFFRFFVDWIQTLTNDASSCHYN